MTRTLLSCILALAAAAGEAAPMRARPSAVAERGFAHVTGAAVDESVIATTLHAVAGGADGDGTAERPFASLTAAVRAAESLLAAGTPVRVRLAAGRYREGGITIDAGKLGGKATATPLVIEGERPGAVVISGSEVLDAGGWRRIEDAAGVRWEHAWPHDFGFNPGGWKQYNPKLPLEHRREMLFVDGQVQHQVLGELYAFKAVDPDGATDSFAGVPQNVKKYGTYRYTGTLDPARIPPGSFAVYERPENGDRLVFRPAGTFDPAQHAVEAAVRPHLLWIQGKENVVLRNLVFEHAATQIEAHRAVMIGHWWQHDAGFTNRNVLIEDVVLRHSNGNHLSLSGVRDVTLRRVTAMAGNYGGIITDIVQNMIWDGCETSFNNRRVAGGWSSGGVKIHNTYDAVIRDHVSLANNGTGLWFDISCGTVLVERYVGLGNEMHGLDWEISTGLVVRDTLLAGSLRHDLAIISGSDVVLERCLIGATSGLSAIGFQAGDRPEMGRIFKHLKREPPKTYRLDRLELRDCAVIALPQGKPVQPAAGHDLVLREGRVAPLFLQHHGNPDWFESFIGDGVLHANTLWHSPEAKPFGVRKLYSDGWRSREPACVMVDWADWQRRTAAQGRMIGDPGLPGLRSWDFRPAPGSPLAGRGLPAWRIDDARLAAWKEHAAWRAARPAAGSTVSDVE